jgi:hypothetical protein
MPGNPRLEEIKARTGCYREPCASRFCKTENQGWALKGTSWEKSMVENAMLLTIRTVDGSFTYPIEAGSHRRQNANTLTVTSFCLLLQPSHTENDSFLSTI